MGISYQVSGRNSAALFTLKLHRGDGMLLLAMNWKRKAPPVDMVGFAIEYKEPGGDKFYALKNRLSFAAASGAVNANTLSTRLSPIQKFRWVHFPRNAEMAGEFVYRVTPVFMNAADELSYGDFQEAAIALRRETYPGQLNVSFTRGFVSSQAFVDRYVTARHGMAELLPVAKKDGLDFMPTHPKAAEALAWMGFEARSAILEVLDNAIADLKAQVHVVAYELSERDVLQRLQLLGPRLRIIIDNSADHGKPDSAETEAAARLATSAGAHNVKRQHMGSLQHNKTIVVDGPKGQWVVCGSTNFSWRGLFVQANNALVLRGKKALKPFATAFEAYWHNDKVAGFAATPAASWSRLGIAGVDAQVAFSPHNKSNALLQLIADDVATQTTSCVFYSLAFLGQTKGAIRDAIKKVTESDTVFVYGIADKKIGGLDLQKPNGNIAPVFPAALGKNLPEPFKSEPTGLSGQVGTRMHHKFVVIDFDKPSARVYLGSYNFSGPADTKNGENLLLIRDRRVAVSYAIEALRLFDHYHFRVAQNEASSQRKRLVLARPPRKLDDKPWWDDDYTDLRKARDRLLFA